MLTSSSDPVAILFLIIGVAIIPFLALAATSYTKIVIVLGLLRNALGVQQVPPNMVLNSLAIVLSAYIMAPVIDKTVDSLKIALPASNSALSSAEVFNKVLESGTSPFREFLIKHAQQRDRQFFVRSAAVIWPPEMSRNISDTDLRILVPAFTVSELTEAFQIGFLIYIAFIVVDLVVANILLALGMQMLSPTNISVPFKLLLFVALDGWSLILNNLILTYR
jgi:type III secretion protein R